MLVLLVEALQLVTCMYLVIPFTESHPSHTICILYQGGFIRMESYLQHDNPCCFIKFSGSLQVMKTQLTMFMS